MNIGVREDERADATLGLITVARLSENGRHVVILDFVAPYVKVFDGTGRFERAFLHSGSGPGEARFPLALAVSGDTTIFVADASGRLMVFGMDGVLRREATDTRMQVLAATSGCSGDWVLYGPKFGSSAAKPTWLHRLRVGAGGGVASTDVLQDSVAYDILPHGVAYGLVSDARGALIWHTLGPERLLASWVCGGASPVAARDDRGPGEKTMAHREAGGVRMEIRAGSRFRGGIASVPGGVVIAEHVTGREPGSATTALTLRRQDGTRRTISVPGSYTLRDSRPGVGVLISTTDPVPQVFLVSERDLLAAFEP
jgi:hypothetical protein